MKTNITPEKKLNRTGWKVLFLSLLALAGALVVQVVGYITAVLLNVPEEGLAFVTIAEAITAGTTAVAMIALGGATWLKPSWADVKEMFRTGWPIVAANVALLVFAGISFVTEGSTLATDWLPNLAVTTFLCLCIGISEEVMYRGVLLNAVLAVTGRSHRGTMAAIAIISLLFGLAHVSITTDFATPFLATQGVLKIIQTGLFSVIMCSVVLRTHRLGGVSIFHGLSDFLLMVPTLVMAGEQLTTNYVSAGDEGISTIVLYLVIIAFYLPMAIRALRKMHREHVTYRGVFMEHASTTQQHAQLPAAPANTPNAA